MGRARYLPHMTRAGPWSPHARRDSGTVTCLEGACFCISSRRGDVVRAGTQGLYFLDTRFLSEFSVLVNDDAVLALEPGRRGRAPRPRPSPS